MVSQQGSKFRMTWDFFLCQAFDSLTQELNVQLFVKEKGRDKEHYTLKVKVIRTQVRPIRAEEPIREEEGEQRKEM